ncbi:MAG: hypothetical protein KKD94_03675 [Nanoarchaeota archaeon]|nr:hypothetical protein [Nanoarchaeota archaeon]
MNKRGFVLAILIFAVVVLGVILAVYFLVEEDDKTSDENGELNECNDGTDNDGDGKVDYLIDEGCENESDNDESDCGDGICEGEESFDSCSDDCLPLVNETHAICSNNSCVEIEGMGEDGCSTDADCQSDEGLPDLIISNISMEITDEITNSTTNVTVYSVTVYTTVKNIGESSAEQSTTRVSFGGELFPLSFTITYTPSLEPDQETIVESVYDELEEGEYDATASVDHLLKIEELDEENNGFGVIMLVVSDSN